MIDPKFDVNTLLNFSEGKIEIADLLKEKELKHEGELITLQ